MQDYCDKRKVERAVIHLARDRRRRMETPAFDREILPATYVLLRLKTLITHTFSCRYYAVEDMPKRNIDNRAATHADTMAKAFENMHIAE